MSKAGAYNLAGAKKCETPNVTDTAGMKSENAAIAPPPSNYNGGTFPGHSDPRSVSTFDSCSSLAGWSTMKAGFSVSGTSGVATGTGDGAVLWRVPEAVAPARMGLLFVGVKA